MGATGSCSPNQKMTTNKSTHWSDAFFNYLPAIQAVEDCMARRATEADTAATLGRIADEFITETECPFGRAWLVREFLDRME